MSSFAPLDVKLLDKLKKHGQMHVLRYWDELSLEQQRLLCTQLDEVNFDTLERAIKQSNQEKTSQNPSNAMNIEPVDPEIIGCFSKLSQSRHNEISSMGLNAIANGKVGMLILAGGQGTRLNTIYPKGMFDLQLLSSKTLFQLQAEKIMKIKELAMQYVGKTESTSIPWYVMTSEHTLTHTQHFFESNSYFKYPREDVIFFEQNNLPVLHFDGQIAMVSKNEIGIAPDGNGGIFSVLESVGILEDMRKRGVEYLHVCSVDNVLVKPLDPMFIGFSIETKADCSLKVIEKIRWDESLGVICKRGDAYSVVEYSEIPEELASKKDPSNNDKLLFSLGNICIHFFTRAFLERVSSKHLDEMKYHIAKKKMTTVALCTGEQEIPKQPNVIKFEKFIFDVVPFSINFRVWQVNRQEEFSPLKNACPSTIESPISCRLDLEKLHLSWLRKANLLSTDFQSLLEDSLKSDRQNVVEVSPLVSYDGEGLENLQLTITKLHSLLEMNETVQLIQK